MTGLLLGTNQQAMAPCATWRSPGCIAVVLLLITFLSPLLWRRGLSLKDLERQVIKPVLDRRWRLIEQKKMSMKRYQLPPGLADLADSLDAAGSQAGAGTAATSSNDHNYGQQQQPAADSGSNSSHDGAAQPSRPPAMMPVYVVSVPRLADRHANMARCMATQNVSYEMVWGVDGKQEGQIPDTWVHTYAGGRYRKWLAGNVTHKVMMFASLLSHVQSYYRMLSHRDPLAVFLEDDVCIADFPNWTSRLLTALRNLPDDWDILYLWGFGGEVGQLVGPGVRAVHKIAGVACDVVRDRGAQKLLRLLEAGDEHIDKALFYWEYDHVVQAYITDPPLCGVSGKLPSTLEYPKGGHGVRRALRLLSL